MNRADPSVRCRFLAPVETAPARPRRPNGNPATDPRTVPLVDLTWKPVDRTGQSVECFRDGPGDGFLTGQVVRYGDGWHAYAHRRRVGGVYATAGEAQAVVSEALRGE